MQRLCYQALDGSDAYLLRAAPERVLQFGEGNFLRGFADHFIDVMNERAEFNGKVVVVPPASTGKTGRINDQEGLYQLYLRGRLNGAVIDERRTISCISRALDVFREYDAVLETAHNPDMRFIISNTTEAGIIYDPSCAAGDRPPVSFPAKLTQLLYERYRALDGGTGYIILPCELIDSNGSVLKEYVLRHARDWALEDGFLRWLEAENCFCNTLVDRIVTGYPSELAAQLNEECGLEDRLLDVAEPFALWVIEGPKFLEYEFPAARAGLPIRFVDNHKPYKEQKVRILNGGHTAMVPAAFLAGHDIVRTCMEDKTMRTFLERALFTEIIPTLTLPIEDCEIFARAVEERFDNPYIDHRLLDIALNSVSKWRTRVLPSVTTYLHQFKKLPPCLAFSFSALAAFYTQDERRGVKYPIHDDAAVLSFFADMTGAPPTVLIPALCARSDFWGSDLRSLPEFVALAEQGLIDIRAHGIGAALRACTGRNR